MSEPAPIPSIDPVPSSAYRPLWSVMIPTYNPDQGYLRQTLESVLEQDPGSDRMQIDVVDDCSRTEWLESLVGEFGGGRVGFHRHDRNLGIGGNWNASIARARGYWVHLLHQDDLVYPGFYEQLTAAIDLNPQIGAAYTQHHLLDRDGRKRRLMSQNPAKEAGIVEDWVEYVFVQLTFQTPSVVVRRDAYESLGGFRSDFGYTLDWDMWKRIAAKYPFWFDPTPLAAYRRHPDATSMRYLRSGRNMSEIRRSIEVSKGYLPEHLSERVAMSSRAHYASDAVDAGLNGLFTLRDLKVACAQFREAWRLSRMIVFPRLCVNRFIAAVSRWRRDRRTGRTEDMWA